MRKSGRAPIAAPASAQTRRIRARVSSTISPLDSASGMNCAGGTSEPSGLRQRTSTSALTTRAVVRSTIG